MKRKIFRIKTAVMFSLLLSAVFKAQLLAAQPPLIFNHLTAENGLSSGSVLSVTQDQKGFLWVGTMDGLNRYDGSRVKIFKSFYRNNPIGPSIKINQLLADRQQNLWIGTNNGLYVYNTQLDSFQVFYHASSDKNSLPHNNIKALCLDRQGNMWVGTQNGLARIVHNKAFTFHSIPIVCQNGSFSFSSSSDEIQAVYETKAGQLLVGTTRGMIVLSNKNAGAEWTPVSLLLKESSIASITEDKSQNIWAGTNGSGLFTINKGFTSVKQYRHQDDKNTGPVSNIIRKIITDRKGRLWIGTLKGLSFLDPATGQFESYVHQSDDEHTLNFNSIYDIFEDRQGTVWIGTFFGGLNVVEAIKTPFKLYQNQEGEKGISSNVIGPIIDDPQNNLWIGTEAEGLNYFDRKRQVFKRYKSDEAKRVSLSSNLVKALIRDKDNHIWVGMHSGGVSVLDPLGRKLKQFNTGKGSNAINSDDVICLLQDDKDRVWIGTEESGINIYDFRTDQVKKFETVFPGIALSSKSITCLFKDTKQNIWIGTKQGLSWLQADGRGVRNYFRNNSPGQLQSDYINCISEDRNGMIWIGTYSGLSFYDPIKKKFGTYTTTEGLAGNKVVGIITDNRNNLWISTNNGLSCLDATRTRFHTFTGDDGLPGNVFNYNSFFKDRNGHLFFGGYKGLVEFDPEAIETNSVAPVVMLTGLNINGEPVKPSDHWNILANDIAVTDNVILKYNQNILSVDYAVMNFIKPGKNKSAYKLEGYDPNWKVTDRHAASFTNLPPGQYTLLIKACNNDGVWNPAPANLLITILPPPWKTWWAYSLYTIGFLLLLFTVIYFFASRAALRRKLRYEHLMNIKQQELHQMKMDFFTHISHEIRTPLTMIMGPVEMLQSSMTAKPANQKLLLTIKNNAERLLKLTNDLLEFRKADSGYTQLKIRPDNLIAFSQSVYAKFTGTADKKSIAYSFESEEENIEVYFDPHHIEIVLSNLLSNAMKFTPEGGRISVCVARNDHEVVEIMVRDNGIGIPHESQDKIFTHFYQADAGSLKHAGSGIGLAFSKSLVELHQGQLTFSSEHNTNTGGRETCFTVTLKLGKHHLNQNDLDL